MSTRAPDAQAEGGQETDTTGLALPKVPTVDGPRPYFAAAQALDPPRDLLAIVGAPARPLAARLSPTAYQLLLWLSLDLWGQHDRRGPVTSPSMDQLQMWCGVPYMDGITDAQAELETAGLVSIGRGRARDRNRYGLTFALASPSRFAVAAAAVDYPRVRELAAMPAALTGTRSMRTMLLVAAVACGPQQTFAMSQTRMRYAAGVSRSTYKKLIRRLTAAEGTEWADDHRWLERVEEGTGPDAPTVWRLRIPGAPGVPWPASVPLSLARSSAAEDGGHA